MAKDLPYFKFFCSEWNDGDITLEDYETQGLFINICSYYWSNGCDVSLKKLKKKFKQDELIDNLIVENIFKIDDGAVVISFLIEQLGDRDTLSNQNSINAKKRWDDIREKKRLESERNAIASKSQSEIDTESMQYREEKRREEKKREENINKKKFVFRKSLIEFGFNETLIEDWLKVRKLKKSANTETAFNGFISQIEKTTTHSPNEILKICVEKSWAGFKSDWLSESRAKTNKPLNFKQQSLEDQFAHLNLDSNG